MGSHRKYRDLAAHLVDRRTAITREQAIATYGISALNRCVAEGLVVRVLPGTYVHATLATQSEVRMKAASLWSAPRGALTGMGAAWAWGLLEDPPREVTVQFPQPLHLRTPNWLRVTRPDLGMKVLRVQDLRVVWRTDAAIQAWCEARPDRRVGLVVDAVRLGNMKSSDLREAAERRKRVRARAELYSLLTLLDGGVKSFLEHHARVVVFPDRDFPELLRQHPVVAMGRRRELDAYDPIAKLALEFDSAKHHSGEAKRLADIKRDAELMTIGIATIRLPFKTLMENVDWCQAVYRNARAARLADLHDASESGPS